MLLADVPRAAVLGICLVEKAYLVVLALCIEHSEVVHPVSQFGWETEEREGPLSHGYRRIHELRWILIGVDRYSRLSSKD
jgi:hypothetical protein